MQRKMFAAALVVLALSACSPMSRMPEVNPGLAAAERDKQMELALRERARRNERLASVGWRILAANVDACGEKVKPKFGVWFEDESGSAEAYRPAWRRTYGSHGRFHVFHTAPGSPAAESGLLPGDVLLSVGGIETDTPDGRQKVRELLSSGKDTAVTFKYRRGTSEQLTAVTPRKVCDYPVELKSGDAVNAYADGSKVFVTQGMMRFATTDEELALVVGHELGHNTQNHMEAKMGNRLIGAIIGALISVAVRTDVSQIGAEVGQGAYSKEFEAEADYVGTYYAAKAGFNVDRAADFWRRMAVEHPAAIGHGTTHPDTASRFVAIEAAVKEVADKRVSGAALVPEKKP